MNQSSQSLPAILSPFAYNDPLPEPGFWGYPTGHDWCEENYAVTYYIAELINTITNLIYVVLGAYLYRSAKRNRHGQIFLIVGIGFCLVGLGSASYHMTLTRTTQLLDELPMIYFTSLPTAYLFAIERKSQWAKLAIYAGFALSQLAFTLVYLFFYRNQILHQVVYGTVNVLMLYKTVTMTLHYVRDEQSRSFMFQLFAFAMSEVVGAFFAWNVDALNCPNWIAARRFLGLPLGILLEWHGWWHILTGLGIYHYILFTQLLNGWFQHTHQNYVLQWRFGMPFDVVLRKKAQD